MSCLCFFNSASENEHKTVLVTGFAPFNNASVNPSGEAVKLINKKYLESKLNISLVTEELKVEYEYVDNALPGLWHVNRPDLGIHVGVSEITNGFTLEKVARKKGYVAKDDAQYVPDDAENSCEGPVTIETDLQVDHICQAFNASLQENSLRAVSSGNAGLYLCEYTYYTSMSQQVEGSRSCLFVHVPSKSTREEFEELARGLERLVEICVYHIRDRHSDRYGSCK